MSKTIKKLKVISAVSIVQFSLKGSLSPAKNENKVDKDLFCTLERFVLICFVQSNQGRRDSLMHEFSSNVNKVNRAVATVRTIGDRLPLSPAHDSATLALRREHQKRAE